MEAAWATQNLLDRIARRRWGVAVAAIRGDDVDIAFDCGDDPVTPGSTFQVGSITKTMTGVVLATAVERDELRLDSTLGEVLGVGGPAGRITALQLATQRSGLPRLPPNLDLTAVDDADPYAAYTADDLLAALEEVIPGETQYSYTNFGFMVLGRLLAVATGAPVAELLRHRIFDPLGMTTAGCPPPDAGRMPGYAEGGEPTPWWRTNLPGPGGVGASVQDLLIYARAHLEPSTTALASAIELATTIHAEGPAAMGLGWGHMGGGWFHDGGTGGFSSFIGFFRPTSSAVVILANGAGLALSKPGVATLTSMARS